MFEARAPSQCPGDIRLRHFARTHRGGLTFDQVWVEAMHRQCIDSSSTPELDSRFILQGFLGKLGCSAPQTSLLKVPFPGSVEPWASWLRIASGTFTPQQLAENIQRALGSSEEGRAMK
ncbi:unnamed protein product [Symbiodinium natans]|uniref:Uncharacterized protein n=1 Tax=Symbiodinium natans TaxID=878477 RepID=A0A812N7M1_9DINO|nr:unnamed protein product [Symbiodinium natans]